MKKEAKWNAEVKEAVDNEGNSCKRINNEKYEDERKILHNTETKK